MLLASGCALWLVCTLGVGPGRAQSPQTSDISQPIPPQEHVGPSPIPATPSAQETGSLLIHNALRQAVWGPARSCKIRQRTTLLDKQLISYGSYMHAGQGSGQLKMHVRLATEKRINTLLQVSDGRVMYSTQHIGNTVQRSRVDLYRIREYLGPISTASLEDPIIAMYLAVGGQAELLRIFRNNIAGRTFKPASSAMSKSGCSAASWLPNRQRSVHQPKLISYSSVRTIPICFLPKFE